MVAEARAAGQLTTGARATPYRPVDFPKSGLSDKKNQKWSKSRAVAKDLLHLTFFEVEKPEIEVVLIEYGVKPYNDMGTPELKW